MSAATDRAEAARRVEALAASASPQRQVLAMALLLSPVNRLAAVTCSRLVARAAGLAWWDAYAVLVRALPPRLAEAAVNVLVGPRPVQARPRPAARRRRTAGAR